MAEKASYEREERRRAWIRWLDNADRLCDDWTWQKLFGVRRKHLSSDAQTVTSDGDIRSV